MDKNERNACLLDELSSLLWILRFLQITHSLCAAKCHNLSIIESNLLPWLPPGDITETILLRTIHLIKLLHYSRIFQLYRLCRGYVPAIQLVTIITLSGWVHQRIKSLSLTVYFEKSNFPILLGHLWMYFPKDMCKQSCVSSGCKPPNYNPAFRLIRRTFPVFLSL